MDKYEQASKELRETFYDNPGTWSEVVPDALRQLFPEPEPEPESLPIIFNEPYEPGLWWCEIKEKPWLTLCSTMGQYPIYLRTEGSGKFTWAMSPDTPLPGRYIRIPEPDWLGLRKYDVTSNTITMEWEGEQYTAFCVLRVKKLQDVTA